MTVTEAPATLDVERARHLMIEQQIRPWEVLDPRVLDLLTQLKREAFVPEAYRKLAFVDMEVPLTTPARDGLCMLMPKVEARLLQELNLQGDEKVLEIGTGSGYMAALLGRLAQRVTTLEIDKALAAGARANLEAAGIGNVDVVVADASAQDFAACRAAGPFDVIVLSGSVAEVPQALLSCLKMGGRLIGVVGQAPMMRVHLMLRTAEDTFQTIQPWDTVAPRLQNFPQPQGFRF